MAHITMKFDVEELTTLQFGLFEAICYYKQMAKETSPQYVDFYQGEAEKAEALYNKAKNATGWTE